MFLLLAVKNCVFSDSFVRRNCSMNSFSNSDGCRFADWLLDIRTLSLIQVVQFKSVRSRVVRVCVCIALATWREFSHSCIWCMIWFCSVLEVWQKIHKLITIVLVFAVCVLQEYAKNPAQNWKSKDAAIFLVTSLAAKAQTQKVGLSSTVQRPSVLTSWLSVFSRVH